MPPAVSNLVPADGEQLEQTTPITFDITDADPLVRVLLAAHYPNLGADELVFDGDEFTSHYATVSSVTAISGGFHFSILRNPVWPDIPTIRAWAFDTAGNEL